MLKLATVYNALQLRLIVETFGVENELCSGVCPKVWNPLIVSDKTLGSVCSNPTMSDNFSYLEGLLKLSKRAIL